MSQGVKGVANESSLAQVAPDMANGVNGNITSLKGLSLQKASISSIKIRQYLLRLFGDRWSRILMQLSPADLGGYCDRLD
jgi:hypothetical protein